MAKGDPIWERKRWEERIAALEAEVLKSPPSKPSDKAKVENAIEVLERVLDAMGENTASNTITLDHDWGYRLGTLLNELKA